MDFAVTTSSRSTATEPARFATEELAARVPGPRAGRPDRRPSCAASMGRQGLIAPEIPAESAGEAWTAVTSGIVDRGDRAQATSTSPTCRWSARSSAQILGRQRRPRCRRVGAEDLQRRGDRRASGSPSRSRLRRRDATADGAVRDGDGLGAERREVTVPSARTRGRRRLRADRRRPTARQGHQRLPRPAGPARRDP